jgi:hypothetical protein
MIAAAQARQQLEQLGLTEAAAVLDARLEIAAQKQLPYADFLADCSAAKPPRVESAICARAPGSPICPSSGRSTNSTFAFSRRSTSVRSGTWRH